METDKDKELWKVAKKRVAFKRHLGTYLLVNAMFWVIWYFSDKESDEDFPWPIWPMVGWGIGLAFSWFDAYFSHGNSAIEKEYEKLKNR